MERKLNSSFPDSQFCIRGYRLLSLQQKWMWLNVLHKPGFTCKNINEL